jgi:hypothetical protein
VKEWTGTIDTGAESSGKREAPGDGVEVYSSSIRVTARFTVAPFVDKRNGPEVTLRGKGEAHVTVSGKSKTTYKDEIITTTYVGDYVDTFNVEISNIDVARGTYQMAVVRDLWQQQPHKGKAIDAHEVKVNKYGTYVTDSKRDGHSWSNDAGAGFGRESPLPKEGFVINGTMTSKNDDFLSTDGSKWDTKWSLRPTPPEEPLKAVAGGPYVVVRGSVVNLDGWQSTGKIRSYKWTFEPVDAKSAIPFNTGAAKDGKRVPTVSLASYKATLTVSDGKKEDSDTVVVTVNARDYKTPFTHREGEKPHPRSKKPFFKKGADVSFAGGENVCALDSYGDKDSVHVLHPAAKAGTWKDIGYKTKKVADGGGPFDGVWYLDEYAVRVEREMLINNYLLPEGPSLLTGIDNVYNANKKEHIENYLAAIRKHELLHSELMAKGLAKNDPGPKIEALASRDESEIKTAADKEIRTSEDVIDKGSQDPLPDLGFRGPMKFPDDATGKYIEVEVGI